MSVLGFFHLCMSKCESFNILVANTVNTEL